MADILTLRKFETLSPFEIKNELIEFGLVVQRFKEWIHSEEWPTGEPCIHASFEPGHRVACLAEHGVDASNLIVRVMRMPEGLGARECGPYAFERRRPLLMPGVEHALVAHDPGLVR